MGIRGLMSFVMKHSDLFLESFELHDTYLAIDGHNISIQLYHFYECDCCFGGDYENFAFYVNKFFDELIKCNITPIVFFDGGSQDKKLNTIYKCRQENIYRLTNLSPDNRQHSIPLLLTVVFKYVVKQKNIICIQSILEADNDIASIAKVLNCPVLSFDSDFYLFDVLFIPYVTLKEGTLNNGSSCSKQCQIFKLDNLIKNYPGMNKDTVLLSAVVLGNDFTNPIILKIFHSMLKIPKRSEKMNFSHLKIEAVFRWLQNHSLDSAITSTLCKLDVDKEEEIIKAIETIINEYLNLNVSSVMLELFYEKGINIFINNLPQRTYKFEKIDNFKFEEKLMDDECYLNDYENYLINTQPFEEDMFYCKPTTTNLSDIIPSWFLKEYHTGVFPSYFINIMKEQRIFVFEQIENFSYPSTFNISLRILSVIFRLLTTGLNINSNILKYITRGKSTKLVTCELDCNQYKFNFLFPSLEKLKDYPANKKKEIFNITMRVSEKLVLKFPPKWRLYIISIKFWMYEADKMFKTKYHLYALVFNMIWHIIKEVKHSNFIKINQDENKDQCNSFVEDMSVKDALENVNIHDCLTSEEFFKSQMLINKRHFDLTIIHAFALLQNCLKSCIHLCSLLGNPYPQVNVAEFFNGILVNNIFNDIRRYKKLNQRICTVFQNSPSLLQLFISISKQILSD